MMAGMDVDSPPPSPPERRPPMSPRDRIVQRLVLNGCPSELLERSPMGLVTYMTENKPSIPQLVSSILPTEEDIIEVQGSSDAASERSLSNNDIDDMFGESMVWLQWLMFHCEPQDSLMTLAFKSSGERAVCGAVWGQNDLAYRCRTCEHDPTCAICVPCFQNGNHQGHDYSIMYTGGGCCDCGDLTAWKREGFCSKHKGIELIQHLPEELANSIGPILDALFVCWKDALLLAEHSESTGDRNHAHVQIGEKLTSSVVEMLLKFCQCSESLLTFVSRRMFECIGLLDVVVKAERFTIKKVVKKLHELLLKLLGEPLFKYEFAKVFTRYYPVTVAAIIRECSDTILEKYPLLSTFSVQIFTVPTLTPRLVREVNLLGVLSGCLADLIQSCAGEDGHLQASKWENIYESTIRVVEDTRYVLSHEEVFKYIACERHDILTAWLKLLTFVQGMNAQKRATGNHAEEESEHISAPFVLEHFLGNVNNLFVQGAFSVGEAKQTKAASFCYPGFEGLDDSEDQRYSKVGRTSEESSVCSTSGRNDKIYHALECSDQDHDSINDSYIPLPATWLISECLKAIYGWMSPETLSTSKFFDVSRSNNLSIFRKKLSKKKITESNKFHIVSVNRQEMNMDQMPATSVPHYTFSSLGGNMLPQSISSSGLSDDNLMEVDSVVESEPFAVLSTADWPNIVYDVSSQDISFHIPLHRLLSMILRKAMENCFGDSEKLGKTNSGSSLALSECGQDFFGQVLGGLHPYGFSAHLMEHTLRLRVFCAQVHAGMWRRNGDAAMLCSELYRSVQWSKEGLESDLFLLQCCAALAPPEQFVKRIQERFGLLNYTSLNISEQNEHEAVLVHELLILIIQIIKERRFSGLTTIDNLKRELVYKLAVADATHSQLVKSLPRDLSKSDQLQNVVDMIAVYSNPSQMKQGKYSLRKAYWRELDLYHPRWNSRDLQVAEERYHRFCNVSALNIQLPQWTGIYEPLKTISKIATSKAVFQIIHAVLFYAAFMEVSSVPRAPDKVLITALHLLSLALDICGSHSHIPTANSFSDMNSSHPDDQSCMGLSHNSEDLPPLLTYSAKEFGSHAHDVSSFCKSQSMISLLITLMKKHKEESDSQYTDARHCNISSLVENLLKKFAELNSECLALLQRLEPKVVSGMLQQSGKVSAQSSVSSSDAKERKAKARERQAAMLEKMRAEQSKFIASLKSAPDDESNALTHQGEEPSLQDHVLEESAPVCSLCRDPHSRSPLCFLVLLQKSRISTFVERGPLSWEDGGRSDEEIPSGRVGGYSNLSDTSSHSPVHLVQNAGLEFPFIVEPAEIDASLNLFKDQLFDIRSTQAPSGSINTGMDISLSPEMIEDHIYESVVEEMRDGKFHLDVMDGKEKYLAAYVAAEPKKGRSRELSVLGEYVACLSRESKQNRSSLYGIQRIGNVTSRSPISINQINGFGPRDSDGIHMSSCGHAVHQECHDRYLSSLKQRYVRRLGFEGIHIVDPDLGELLCPVCRRFANSLLPAFPSVSDKVCRRTSLVIIEPSNSFPSTSSNKDESNLHLPLALSLLCSSAKMVSQGRTLKALSGKISETVNPALVPCLQKLYTVYYPCSNGSLSEPGRLSQSLILWDTLRYSLVSTEIAARGRLCMYHSGPCFCLKSLYGELMSFTGHILSVLLQVAQSARCGNRLEVLLRFRGLQLLAGSICSGISCLGDLSNEEKRKGILSSLLEQDDNGEAFPDIQLWKQTADPILAQDPFSSLLWVIFCLPAPFALSSEFFTALVHLFYAVCVVQAMITCYTKWTFDKSTFSACLLNEVCKRMSETELARDYFVSHHIDVACLPRDMIRRLTFPYLRRCALLWKLLQSSTSTPSSDSLHATEGSYLYKGNDEPDNTSPLEMELTGIKELEDMFKICSLDQVLNNKVVHVLSLRWCHHFCEEIRVREYRSTLCSIPALPFKLIKLPHIYQDLLQRYVKMQCSNCNLVPEEPVLCLLCGQLCSPNWKSCCRPSKCSNHALACGAGIGVFLSVKKTTILLQRSARQATWPSLYLDAFGEEDIDMHRGRPLYLSEERYAALTYLVASHGLDRNSEVLQHTTMNFLGLD